MSYFKRTILFAFIAIFLSLNIGVDVYRVHCDMRNKTYISLLTSYDPCLDESQIESETTCCSTKSHCSIEDDEKDKDSCCDEEEITITYEPDFFHNTDLKPSLSILLALEFIGFSFSSIPVFEQNVGISCYPQPPPLSGRDILTLHAVLRI